MAIGFVLLMRETLEAALVVIIVLGYLKRTGHARDARWVYFGVALGVGGSVLGALAFERLAGGFEGRGEQLFEGVVMIAGAALLTTMIVWLARRSGIEGNLQRSVSRSGRLGLLVLVFLSVLREGVESVIFLAAAATSAQGSLLAGALLGLAAALALGLLVFRGARRVALRPFFTGTNVLLILFAAGLVSQGAHELGEAGVLPVAIEHLWDLNPALRPDGSFPLLHESGVLGSFAKSLFGYDGDPSLLQVASYTTYLAGTLTAWGLLSARRRRAPREAPPA